MSNPTRPRSVTRKTIPLLCDYIQPGRAFYLFLLSPPSSLFFSFSAFYEFLSAFLPLPPPQGHAAHFRVEHLLSKPGPFTDARHKYAF